MISKEHAADSIGETGLVYVYLVTIFHEA